MYLDAFQRTSQSNEISDLKVLVQATDTCEIIITRHFLVCDRLGDLKRTQPPPNFVHNLIHFEIHVDAPR